MLKCSKLFTRKRPREKLYELEVIEKDRLNRRVKVDYVGYDSEDDEWRNEKDIKIIYPVQGNCCDQPSYLCAWKPHYSTRPLTSHIQPPSPHLFQ